MSVLLLAIGTTRARAVCGYGRFLADRGVDVSLITSSAAPWTAEGLDERVTVLPVETAVDRRLLAMGPVAKFYRLVRPYALWRSARRRVVGRFDWPTVEQVVVCDSHAIPIAWHVARKHPDLTVGFELDRTPFLDHPASASGLVPPEQVSAV